ncbi:PH domain-containing protein [Evansella sp. AB-P1]|uniref:PH domain-containing protein n=1 Tax=Evansella sp. AB-P1 TaxID=3037653 RepID=UPI00241ED35E|nr:PH domain-containing protein [Evansella sp. AB-P1]MDG5787539.1 PH domain-containing protein [Evansella sp. AB-P1]
MRELPNKKLAQKTLSVWKIVASIESVFLLLIPIAYYIGMRYIALPTWILYLILTAAIIYSLIKIIIIPKLKWQKWRYEIFENEVELMYGVFVVRRVIIPMIRVQHVDTKHGPLLRHYKLSSVTISTAATIHEIPGLEENKAGELRDYIAKLAREADQDD